MQHRVQSTSHKLSSVQPIINLMHVKASSTKFTSRSDQAYHMLKTGEKKQSKIDTRETVMCQIHMYIKAIVHFI